MSDVTLHLGDCLEYMRTLPDGCVDAVITDPPYGTATRYWDTDVNLDVWRECLRLCPDGPIAVFGYAKQLFRMASIMSKLELIGFVVWHKPNEPVVSPGLTRVHQDIAVWGRSVTQLRASDVRLPYQYDKNKALSKFFGAEQKRGDDALGKRLQGSKEHERGRRCDDLWTINVNHHGFNAHMRHHPNQKPLDLMSRLVSLASTDESIVFDPFMGSGTTGVACVQTGRKFIGCEIDPGYFAIAEKRIREAQAQPRLPLDEPDIAYIQPAMEMQHA